LWFDFNFLMVYDGCVMDGSVCGLGGLSDRDGGRDGDGCINGGGSDGDGCIDGGGSDGGGSDGDGGMDVDSGDGYGSMQISMRVCVFS
ncbi:hypothetical protein Tco_0416807, partial [Tanacetum coccineum]